MKFLRQERKLFDEVQAGFWKLYKAALRSAHDLAEERGAALDKDTPLHHRMSAQDMRHEVSKKARRCESVLSLPDWAEDKAHLAKVIEEAGDIINYAAFLIAHCGQLMADIKMMQSTPEVHPQPERKE